MMTNAIGQIGCVTGIVAVLIIALAFGAGWFIDDWLGNEKKIVTVIFMIGSFPVTLYAMVRISLTMVSRAQQQVKLTEKSTEEDKEET